MQLDLLDIIYFLFLLLSLLAGLTVYFEKDVPLYLKLFPPFLVITIIMGVVVNILKAKYRNSHVANNFYTLLEVPFYLFVLNQITRNRKIRKVILNACWLFAAISLLNMIFRGAGVFHVSVYVFGAFLVLISCGYYFYELVKMPAMIKPTRDPGFWISLGLLIYFGGTLPIYGAVSFSSHFPASVTKVFRVLLYVVNYLYYPLLTIAFLCRFRIRKSQNISSQSDKSFYQ